MSYELMDLEQGSAEWLKFRLKHVTASNMPAVFGASAYKTALEYAKELLTQEESPLLRSYVFQKGHEVEAAAREWCMDNLGMGFMPKVVRSRELPYLAASLDGMDESKGVLFEAKYVSQDRLDRVKGGVIDLDHSLQLQTQLLVTGFKKLVYFTVGTKGESAYLEVEPDSDVQKRIVDQSGAFWKGIQEGVLPEATERDTLIVQDAQLVLLSQWDFQLGQLQRQYDLLKEEVLAKYEKNMRVQGKGVSITRYWQKGVVDWSAVKKAKGIPETELERFRKSGSFRSKVTFKKE